MGDGALLFADNAAVVDAVVDAVVAVAGLVCMSAAVKAVMDIALVAVGIVAVLSAVAGTTATRRMVNTALAGCRLAPQAVDGSYSSPWL